MTCYTVVGKMVLYEGCEASCPDWPFPCDGYHQRTVDVALEVEAPDESEAVYEACHQMRLRNSGTEDAEWVEPPTVIEAPQDILMARLGPDIAPALPGIEAML